MPVKEAVRVRTYLVPLRVSDSKLNDYFEIREVQAVISYQINSVIYVRLNQQSIHVYQEQLMEK